MASERCYLAVKAPTYSLRLSYLLITVYAVLLSVSNEEWRVGLT